MITLGPGRGRRSRRAHAPLRYVRRGAVQRRQRLRFRVDARLRPRRRRLLDDAHARGRRRPALRPPPHGDLRQRGHRQRGLARSSSRSRPTSPSGAWVCRRGLYPLAHACVYLASAPKSNAVNVAWHRAKALVEEHGALPVPKKLRNAVTKLMKEEEATARGTSTRTGSRGWSRQRRTCPTSWRIKSSTSPASAAKRGELPGAPPTPSAPPHARRTKSSELLASAPSLKSRPRPRPAASPAAPAANLGRARGNSGRPCGNVPTAPAAGRPRPPQRQRLPPPRRPRPPQRQRLPPRRPRPRPTRPGRAPAARIPTPSARLVWRPASRRSPPQRRMPRHSSPSAASALSSSRLRGVRALASSSPPRSPSRASRARPLCAPSSRSICPHIRYAATHGRGWLVRYNVVKVWRGLVPPLERASTPSPGHTRPSAPVLPSRVTFSRYASRLLTFAPRCRYTGDSCTSRRRIETVADDELVLDGEPQIIDLHRDAGARRLVEERADLHGLRLPCAEEIHQVRDGEPGIDDVLDEEHVLAGDRGGRGPA